MKITLQLSTILAVSSAMSGINTTAKMLDAEDIISKMDKDLKDLTGIVKEGDVKSEGPASMTKEGDVVVIKVDPDYIDEVINTMGVFIIETVTPLVALKKASIKYSEKIKALNNKFK